MKSSLVFLCLLGVAYGSPILENSNLQHTLAAATPYDPSCSCNKTQVWNDIMFVIDRSFFTGFELKRIYSDVLSILQPFTLGTYSTDNGHTNLYSQAGVVFYGSTAQVGLPLGSTYADFTNLNYSSFYDNNDAVTNLGVGLDAAYDQLYASMNSNRNGAKVVVVMATTYDKVGITEDPMTSATKLKSRNATIMVYKYPEILITDGIRNKVLHSIATSPAWYFNTTLNTVEDLQKAQCTANCFCPGNMPPFLPDQSTGAPNQGCYMGSEAGMYVPPAASTCTSYNQGILIKIENGFKQSFAQSLMTLPEDYWIGLSYNSSAGGWVWPDNTKLGLYNNFLRSAVPAGKDGDCVVASYAQKRTWVTAPCDDGEKEFICEIQPCDSTNFCHV